MTTLTAATREAPYVELHELVTGDGDRWALATPGHIDPVRFARAAE